MRRSIVLLALFSLFLSACNNLEDAKVIERKTFMHFYEAANSLAANTAIEVPEEFGGGFLISGTIELEADRKILLIRTDGSGIKQWEKTFDGASVSNISVLEDGSILVVGQNVTFNKGNDIDEFENYDLKVLKLDPAGNILKEYTYSEIIKDNNGNYSGHVDFFGNAVTVATSPEDNQEYILVLGSYKAPGNNEYAYVTALNPQTLDSVWAKDYNYIVRNYSNARSLYVKDDKIIWATNISETIGNFEYSYVSVPVIGWKSSFENSNYYGQNEVQQALRINDMKAWSAQFGAIGTISDADGTKGNIFFIKIDPSGNFIPGSEVYFDGSELLSNGNAISDPTASSTEDTGVALAPMADGGFVLAANMETTPSVGRGGNDVLLVKTDPTGVPRWTKLIGASTSEEATSIIETSDGGILICGTIQDGSGASGGLKSIFLIKTDKNGDLKD